jgi:peptidoglycan/LPS O-acetylase OafA/YrhL
MVAEDGSSVSIHPEPGKHIYGLDILRLVSAIAVMLFHFAFRGEAAGELPAVDIPHFMKSVASYGYLGVSIFFIISGFVIAYSAEGQKPFNFLSVSALVIWLSGNPLFQISSDQYLANIFIFSKLLGQSFVDGAYWSIVLELIFYGWIFILIALGQFHNIIRIIPLWLGFSFLNEFYIGSEHLQNLFITEYSGFFAMGIIYSRLRRQRSFYAVLLFILAAIFAIYTTLAGAEWAEKTYSIKRSPVAMTAIILASIAVLLLLTKLNIGQKHQRMLGTLGGMTYALYLVHQNVGYIAITALLSNLGPVTAIVITMIGLILFATLFHVVVERRINPMIKKKLLLLVDRSLRSERVSI